MIEPTESENKQELDRFCDALICKLKMFYFKFDSFLIFEIILKAIREEISKIEQGIWDNTNNPLRNAPHVQEVCVSSNWNKPYSRETAAYPIVKKNFILKYYFLFINFCYVLEFH